jgi:peptidyl-Lys metalloendopeptidase
MTLHKLTKVCVSVVAALACFGANAASNGVAVNLSAAKTVLQSNDDVVVNVKFTNTSGADQYVLKWFTPFVSAEQQLFDVYRDGVKVDYLGKQAKRTAPVASDYFLVKAGKSYTQQVELSSLYDMSVSGSYSVKYNAASAHLFGGAAAASLAAGKDVSVMQSDSMNLYISGRLSVAAPVQALLQPQASSLSFTSCTSSQSSAITSAVAASKTYANAAYAYFTAAKTGARYTTWFGAYTAARYSTATSHFSAISSAFANQAITVDCSCTDTGTYAYVYPTQPYKIYVCGAFWTAPTTGTDSKGGTLIHEMSHFNVVAGTLDNVYGQTGAKALAISNPTKALANADSHEYFAENNPAQN